MKKIFIISLAVMMLMSFTACSEKVENETPDTTTSATEELPEETEVTTEETTPEETEITTKETENDVDSSSLTTIEKNGYSFRLDEEKWLWVIDYLDATRDDYEDPTKLDELKNRVETSSDVAYYFNDVSGTNFIVHAEEIGEKASEIDLSDNIIAGIFTTALRQQSEESGVIYVSDSMGKINGHPYISVIIETPAELSSNGTATWCETIIFYEGTCQYIFAFTSGKEEFSEYKSEFDAIMNTIDFE